MVEKASGKAKVRRLDVTAGSTDGREIEIAPISGEKLEELWVVVRGGADLSGDGTEEVSIGGGK